MVKRRGRWVCLVRAAREAAPVFSPSRGKPRMGRPRIRFTPRGRREWMLADAGQILGSA